MIRLYEGLVTWKLAQEIRNDPDKKEMFQGASSGIESMDSIGRLLTPFYGVVIARPKAGKTADLLSLALSFAAQGFVVLFNVLEMGALQMLTRVASNMSMVNMDKYNYQNVQDEDWMLLESAIDQSKTYDFFFTFSKFTPQLLAKDINELKGLYPDRKILVVTDYANLMRYPGHDKNGSANEMKDLSGWFVRLTGLEGDVTNDTTADEMLGIGKTNISLLTAVQVPLSVRRGSDKIDSNSAADTASWGNDCHYSWAINQVVDEDGEPIEGHVEITMGGRYSRGGTFRAFFNRAQARYEDLILAPTVEPIIS